MEFLTIGVLGVLGLFLFILLARIMFMVDQQTMAVITRFGKFMRVEGPGLHFKSPFESVHSKPSLRVYQLDITVETKTKDNVFVKLIIPVMYQIIEDKLQDAVFKLRDVKSQITSYVQDVVRAQVPTMTLDEAFEKKDDIAKAVNVHLTEAMDEYGYRIVKTLVTEVDPDASVKKAMNDIQAATREKDAATQRAEAAKITMVAKARAEAESKELQGKGIAKQRMAIAEGLKDSVDMLKGATGVDASEVLRILTLTQYFDAMKDVAAGDKTKVVFFPSSPSGLSDMSDAIERAIMTGQESRHTHHVTTVPAAPAAAKA